MKILLLHILVCLSSLMPVLAGVPADQWELAYDKDGTRVYTQLEEGSPYKQVKITTTINAPVDKVVDILKAFREYSAWMHQVDESYLINQADSAYYVFIRENPAWPIQDRYHVSRVEVRQSYSKARVDFHSVPNYIEKRTDAIQIRQFDGYWALEARSEQQCQLEFVLVQHPGGHVPPWLANLHVTEKPFQSVVRLKELAERQVIRP